MCIAKYSDGNWYRALVVRVFYSDDGEEAVEIQFIDYGNFVIIQDRNRYITNLHI